MIAIIGNQDGFDAKLSRLPDFKYESIPAEEFIYELKSNGLMASKITSIDANLEGKGYSLVRYSTTSGKTGRGFLFDFRDAKISEFFFTEDDKAEKPTKEVLDAKADDAKKEAAKVKDETGAKKFLDDNKEKIEKLSSSLKGDAKKNFDEIVQFVKDNTEKVDEASKSTKHTILLKLLFGCVGVIAFMLSLNTFAWVALSPIVGPLLLGTVKKISGLKESCDKDDKSEEEKESK